jgi:hypothetical protein
MGAEHQRREDGPDLKAAGDTGENLGEWSDWRLLWRWVVVNHLSVAEVENRL